MSRGTSAAERGQINKKRKTDYLNSQLLKLQSKLKNTTDTKSRQRLKQSISSVKKQLDTSPKSFIKSKFEKVKTSRGLKVRPKKTEKPSTIRKVKYPVYKGKVEEKKTETPKTEVKKTETPKTEVKKTKTPKTEVKKTNPLDKYRRTKGEGVGKKTKDQRGDTRITKGLKKAGFTETRLAKLRQKNAAFQKAKKGGKEAMKKYREIYG